MTMTKRWNLDDIPWDRFDRSQIDADIVKIVKAAALVEFNAHDYGTYLGNVFHDDPNFQSVSRDWAEEEIQHGEALGRWAKLADPDFDFPKAVARFRDGFRINVEAKASTRGSRARELVARCMVETGTSSYYTALADAATEPTLKAICQHIAADEHRHYKLFYTHLKTYLGREKVTKLQGLQIALTRLIETEDDELAYAYYAANSSDDEVYDRTRSIRQYMSRAYRYYRSHHIERAIAMIFKACGLRPQSRVFRIAQWVGWQIFARRTRKLQRLATA
jgi:rubrerythrin